MAKLEKIEFLELSNNELNKKLIVIEITKLQEEFNKLDAASKELVKTLETKHDFKFTEKTRIDAKTYEVTEV